MSSTDFLNKQNLFKLFLITLSIIIWVYFFVASKASLDLIIVFDLQSIINTYFTTNFLLFLLFFPLTTIIVISMSFSEDKKINVLNILFGMLIAIAFSMVIFNLSYIFLVFLILYLILHVVISFIASNKYLENPEKKIISIATSLNSIITLLFCLVLFLTIFLGILPDQKIKAEQMEIGVVNLFVGEDITNWVNTSYSISRQCTLANIDFIMSSSQYRALEQEEGKESKAFVNYLESLKERSQEPKTSEDLMALYPDMTSNNIRTNVLKTIKSIPLMNIIESNFAIIFALLVISLVYFYFWLAFLISAIFVVIFYKIFNINKNIENTEQI